MAFDGTQFQLSASLAPKAIKASLGNGWMVEGRAEGFARGLVKGECLFTAEQKLLTSGQVIVKEELPSFPAAKLIHPRLGISGWIVRSLITNKFDWYESITIKDGIVLASNPFGLTGTGARYWAVVDKDAVQGKLLESDVPFVKLKGRCGLAL